MSNKNDLVAGRYRLMERVASGGMGVVWRGWDERLHRAVAIKELLLHPGLDPVAAGQAARRAMREGRITARLQHPHAIPVYDVVEHDGRPCLIMEYLPSRSLQDLLDERGTLTVAEVATIGSQIAGALTAAHRAGIVHRDVKPANVLLSADGNAKLTDFGISRALGDGTLTQSGMLTGTPAYLSPEVAKGASADFPSDVFSLGSTLYTALEGQPPFGMQGNPIVVLHRVASGQLVPPRRCGPLTALILAMLQRDPSARPTMAQVEQALVTAASGVDPVGSDPAVSDSSPTQLLTRPSMTPATRESSQPPPFSTPVGKAAVAPLPRRPRHTRGLPVAVAVAILLAVGGVIAALIVTSRGGTKAAGPSTPRHTVGAPTSATIRSAARKPKGSAAAPTTAQLPPGVGSLSSLASPNERPGSLPRDVIINYYGLVPNNLSQAWTQLTPSYQNESGGFAAYQRFWNSIASVTATDVTTQGDGSVQATITYVYDNGKVVEERTSFGLADDGDQLKISSTAVLSSRTP
ncbi:MAG: protein kinase [Actinomycetota bacterium]